MAEFVKVSELDRRLTGYATKDWLSRNYTLASAFRAGMDPLLRRVSALEIVNESAAAAIRGLAGTVAQLGDVPGLVCSVADSAEQLERLRAKVDRAASDASDALLRMSPAFPLVDVGEAGAEMLMSGAMSVGDACVTSVPAGPLIAKRIEDIGFVVRFSLPPPEVLGTGVRVARDFVVAIVYPDTMDAEPSRTALELELEFEPAVGDSVAFRTRGGDLFTLAGADLGCVVALRFTEVAPSILAVTRTILEDYP